MKYLLAVLLIVFCTLEMSSQRRTFNTIEGKVETALKSRSNSVHADVSKEYYFIRSGELVVMEGVVNGDLLHGLTSFYDKDGNLVSQGDFRNGLKHGQWKTWNSNGEITETNSWRKGMLHGYFKKFTGVNSYEEGYWVRNLKSGKWKTVEEGIEVYSEKFKKGKLATKKEKKKFEIKLFKEKKKEENEEIEKEES